MTFRRGLLCTVLSSLCLVGCGAITHLAIPYEDEVGQQRKPKAEAQAAPAPAAVASAPAAATQPKQAQPLLRSPAGAAQQAAMEKQAQRQALAQSVAKTKSATQPQPVPQKTAAQTQATQAVTVLQVPAHIQPAAHKTRDYYHTANQRALVQREDLLIPPHSTFHSKQ